MSEPYDADEQDQSEALDESNTLGDGDQGETRPYGASDGAASADEMPDVLDLMQVAGDRDDDEAITLDADEFDPEAVSDDDAEEDDELAYAGADAEREDDIDGLGGDPRPREARAARDEIDGLEVIADADLAETGEDDVADLEADDVSDEDLVDLGYSEVRGGEVVARPD